MSRKTVIDAIKLLRIRHGVDVRAVVGNVYVYLYGRKVDSGGLGIYYILLISG